MSEKIKHTYKLSKDKGLKNREIADLLSISERTVEYRLSSAYSTIRKNLKDYLLIFPPFLLTSLLF